MEDENETTATLERGYNEIRERRTWREKQKADKEGLARNDKR